MAMDRSEAEAVTKLLKWTLSRLRSLESQLMAHQMTLIAYPTLLKSRFPTLNSEAEVLLLQASVEAALHSSPVQAAGQKYDAWLARIQERPVSLDQVEAALKDFETLKPKGSVN